ncbi:MAG: NTP transferase domain-containing protein [Rhodothermales bacterium]|nr:NTP transferase domain-containing protein [Rhodothermales bacterium]
MKRHHEPKSGSSINGGALPQGDGAALPEERVELGRRRRSERRRTGVILAAGFGSRLADAREGNDLKPLTPVAGKPLILRTLESLEKAGCDRVVIVLGYCSHTHREAIEEFYNGPLTLHFAVNDRYDLANGISVLSAREFVRDEFILVMADHILGPVVSERARLHLPPEGGATLLVDYKLDSIFDMDDATKVREKNGRIVSIGKQIDDYNCIDTGVFVCTPGLMDALQHVYEEKGDASLSDGVQLLSERGLMNTLDIGEGFWQDVDTPEMLAYAEQVLESDEQTSALGSQIAAAADQA